MLNPYFPKKIGFDYHNYILPIDIVERVKSANTDFNTGGELRLQEIYGFELWTKLKSIGIDLDKFDWHNKTVLDVCCGTGFLSYHLLAKVKPKKLFLIDISPNEVNEAKKLINVHYSDFLNVNYLVSDVLASGLADESFDLIIGNSFLHHFYNVPQTVEKFRQMLKPGGMFITLHEPTPAAVALESGNFLSLVHFLLKGSNYIETIRYKYNLSEVDSNPADVWLFENENILELFGNAKFTNIQSQRWHLLRPLLMAKLALHLSKQKNKISRLEQSLLRESIYIDTFLSKLLPSNMFGSFCLVAQKPN